jgi:hypothetical protein
MEAILKDNYWVVGTNRWTARDYTKEDAEKFAATLINCEDCIDCRYCSYCIYCVSCRYCKHCRTCVTCKSCTDCIRCRSCVDCYSCDFCFSFKSNPERILSPILGSRSAQTIFYWNAKKEQIVCDCFKGTLQQFEDKVKQTHGDNEHAKAYLQWIEKVKIYKA